LLSLDPAGWAARVEVTAASGKLEKQITCIPGDPRRPFDEAQVANKFRQVVSWAVGARAAERLLPLALTALEADGLEPLLGVIDGRY
jgi:2-methylcitrate dehydratase PrpD